MGRWITGVKDVLLTLIALGGVATLSAGALSEYGWVTRSSYASDKPTFVTSQVYAAHVTESDAAFAAQGRVNQEISGSLNEIKALLTIVPQIKSLIRNRCDGGRGLDRTIDDLKNRYFMLTSTEYEEPACGSPELLE